MGTCEQVKERGGVDAGISSATTGDAEMRGKCHRPSGFGRRTTAPSLLLLHDAARGIASSSRLGAAVRRAERGQIQFFNSLLAMNRRVFERYVTEAVDSLPPRFKEALENIDIVIEDFPGPEIYEDPDLEAPLLGLYQGVPLPERGLGDVYLPDKISIYMGEFLRAGYRGKELVEEIRITIFHEIGHYFGLDDTTLEELESS